MVCAHQMVLLRITQLSRRLSPVSILTDVPCWGPKSASLGPVSDQGSGIETTPPLPPRNVSAPTVPSSLLTRIAPAPAIDPKSVANSWTRYIVLGWLLSSSRTGVNSPCESVNETCDPVPF